MASIALRWPPPRETRLAAGCTAVLLLQAAIGLLLGLPGHLSTDSIIQLYEGRTLQRLSFNPPLMSMLLGAFDRIGSAPVAFVLLSQAMLTASSWLVLQTAQRDGWRFALAALCLLNPVVLIHVGIVWKDVLLGHAAVLLYLLIARAWHRRAPVGWTWGASVVSLIAIVGGVRQQGLLFALPAAAWAAATLARGRQAPHPGSASPAADAGNAGAARFAPAFVAALLVFTLLPLAANRAIGELPRQALPHAIDSVSIGWRVLMQFDLVGILAHGGRLPEAALPADAADALQAEVARYTPYRVDTLQAGVAYWSVPPARVAHAWFDAIRLDPLAYARHRVAHFGALLGLADRRSCLPAYSGIGGPVFIEGVPGNLVERLGLRSGPHSRSGRIDRIIDSILHTPLYGHAFYAAAIAVLATLLAMRREFVLATLGACSLALLGSHLLIGIACDFRYGYALTVATSLLAARMLLGTSRPPARTRIRATARSVA